MRPAVAVSLLVATLVLAPAAPGLAGGHGGGGHGGGHGFHGPGFRGPFVGPGFRGPFHPGFRGPFHPGFRGPFHPGFRGPVFIGGGSGFWWGSPWWGSPWWGGPWWGSPWWGGPWWGSPSWSYPPQVIVQPAPVTTDEQSSQSYWHYCPTAKAYYPSVPSCPEAWIKVPPRVE